MTRIDVSTVDDLSDLPDSLFSGAHAHATRYYLGLLMQDPRFVSGLLIASAADGGNAMGFLPFSLPQQAKWHHPGYDPSRWGLHLQSDDARDYLLVGGTSDFRQSMWIPTADVDERNQVAGRLLDAALQLGTTVSRRCLIQYVERDGPLGSAMTANLSVVNVVDVDRYVIPKTGPGLDEYLASLSRGRRSIVRRDLRDLAARDFRTEPTSWRDLPAWTADAISSVRSRHVPTHPRLVAYRLDELGRDPGVERVAFITESSAGARAISIGWFYDSTLELYEVGMPSDGEDELLAYLEVMFYAPLRFLWGRGGGSLDLAVDAPRPKSLRGAQPVPLIGGLGCLDEET